MTLLSDTVRAEIDHWLSRFPAEQKQSAVLAALHALMHEDRYLATDKMAAVAAYLDMPAVAVYEVASFYSLFETDPARAARHRISVCTNVSCMLNGADDLLAHIEDKLGIQVGEVTADGRCYLKPEEECLAACCEAPMMQINHVYYTQLTPAKVDAILDELL